MIGRLASFVPSYRDSFTTAVEEASLREWHSLVYRRAQGRWELANELLTDPDPARTKALAKSAGIILPDVVPVAALPAGHGAPTDSHEGVARVLVHPPGRPVFFLDPAGAKLSLAPVVGRA